MSLVSHPSLFCFNFPIKYVLDFRYPIAGCLLPFCLGMGQTVKTKMRKTRKRIPKGRSQFTRQCRWMNRRLIGCLGDNCCWPRSRPRSFCPLWKSWPSFTRWPAPQACLALHPSSLPSTTQSNARNLPPPEKGIGKQVDRRSTPRTTSFLQTLRNQWRRL